MNPSLDTDSPPLRAAPGLFNLENPKTLGLETISAEHFEIHHTTEESGYCFSHHPSLVIFRDRLYCSWSSGHAHEDRPGQRVVYATSADGRTWSSPQLLCTPPDGASSCVAAGFHVHEDTLVAYHTRTNDFPTHNLYCPMNAVFAMTSNDGAHWSEPQHVASGFFIEGPRSLSDGRLFLGGEHAGDHWKSHQVRMRLMISNSPGGIGGWAEADIDPSAAEPNGLKVFGYSEPCPFVREDGVIVCPFRNQSGFLYASVSRDNGQSWSIPQQTSFPDSMSRFCTGRLPDGQVYLINNPGPGRMNRGLLTIALSRDGELFDRAWILRGEPTTQRFEGKSKQDGWQYPNALVWRAALFVAYSVNKEDVAISLIPSESLA